MTPAGEEEAETIPTEQKEEHVEEQAQDVRVAPVDDEGPVAPLVANGNADGGEEKEVEDDNGEEKKLEEMDVADKVVEQENVKEQAVEQKDVEDKNLEPKNVEGKDVEDKNAAV